MPRAASLPHSTPAPLLHLSASSSCGRRLSPSSSSLFLAPPLHFPHPPLDSSCATTHPSPVPRAGALALFLLTSTLLLPSGSFLLPSQLSGFPLYFPRSMTVFVWSPPSLICSHRRRGLGQKEATRLGPRRRFAGTE